jgi:hypothetical protein
MFQQQDECRKNLLLPDPVSLLKINYYDKGDIIFEKIPIS